MTSFIIPPTGLPSMSCFPISFRLRSFASYAKVSQSSLDPPLEFIRCPQPVHIAPFPSTAAQQEFRWPVAMADGGQAVPIRAFLCRGSGRRHISSDHDAMAIEAYHVSFCSLLT